MTAFQNKDPALYLKACDNIGFHMSFSSTCRLFEWVSIIFPILFFIMIILLVYFCLFRKKTIFPTKTCIDHRKIK
jgi:hypothetical protein